MKALIIDAMSEGERRLTDSIREEATSQGMEVVTLSLRDMSMKRCAGCFTCWVKSPGVCAFKDDGARLTKEWAGSDLIVYITPVFLGSYSPELKRQLDRLIPVLLPYFKNFDGEIHHPQRYPRARGLLAFGLIGSGDVGEAETFKVLVHRNSLNMQSRFCEAMTIDKELDRNGAAALLKRAREALA